jgi:hypothetical protein
MIEYNLDELRDILSRLVVVVDRSIRRAAEVGEKTASTISSGRPAGGSSRSK